MKPGGRRGRFCQWARVFHISRAFGGPGFHISRALGGARVSHFTRPRGGQGFTFHALSGGQGFTFHGPSGGPGFHISRFLGGPGFHISRAFGGPGFHISRAFERGTPGFHISRRALGGQGFTFHALSGGQGFTFHGPSRGGRQGFTNHWPSHGLGAPGSHFCWVSEGAKLFRISRAFGGGGQGSRGLQCHDHGVTGITTIREVTGSHWSRFRLSRKHSHRRVEQLFFGRHDPQTNSCRGLTAGRSVTFR